MKLIPAYSKHQKWAAPAKLNLHLAITGRNGGSGLHRIASLFHTVSLRDELVISFEEGGKGCVVHLVDSVFRQDLVKKEGTSGEAIFCADNILVRTWDVLVEHFGLAGGVSIRLKKNIPSGAGLGGGSSDAAALIRAVVATYGIMGSFLDAASLGEGVLVTLAKAVGSDVPFFLRGGMAWVSGIGEDLRHFPFSLADLGAGVAVGIVEARESIATAEAYVKWVEIGGAEASERLYEDLFACAEKDEGEMNNAEKARQTLEWLKERSWNAFAKRIWETHPNLEKCHKFLSAKTSYTRLTGSGSGQFFVFSQTSKEGGASFLASGSSEILDYARRVHYCSFEGEVLRKSREKIDRKQK